MALDKMSGLIRCKYKIEVTYLNLRKNKNTKLRGECIKKLTIQHETIDYTRHLCFCHNRLTLYDKSSTKGG